MIDATLRDVAVGNSLCLFSYLSVYLLALKQNIFGLDVRANQFSKSLNMPQGLHALWSGFIDNFGIPGNFQESIADQSIQIRFYSLEIEIGLVNHSGFAGGYYTNFKNTSHYILLTSFHDNTSVTQDLKTYSKLAKSLIPSALIWHSIKIMVLLVGLYDGRYGGRGWGIGIYANKSILGQEE